MTTKVGLKTKWNLLIDAIMLVALMLISGLGFLIKFVLIPGFERNVKYGSDVELFFWGLTRHQWGTVHLVVSFVFLFLIVLHIILHWKMVKGLYGRIFPNKIVGRTLAIGLCALCILFSVGPLAITPHVEPGIHGHAAVTGAPSEVHEHHSAEHKGEAESNEALVGHDELDINGSMSLYQVSAKYGVSADTLASILGVPVSMKDEKLGRLHKQYVFQMSEVREAVLKCIQGVEP